MPVVSAVTASRGARRVPTRRMLAACSAAAGAKRGPVAQQEHDRGRARRSADHEQRPVADEAEQASARRRTPRSEPYCSPESSRAYAAGSTASCVPASARSATQKSAPPAPPIAAPTATTSMPGAAA